MKPTYTTTAYVKYEDPSHGWLQVPMAEVRALGILGEISDYSYTDLVYAYLEEDCDMDVFIRAKKAVGVDITLNYFSTDNDSFVRNLRRIK